MHSAKALPSLTWNALVMAIQTTLHSVSSKLSRRTRLRTRYRPRAREKQPAQSSPCCNLCIRSAAVVQPRKVVQCNERAHANVQIARATQPKVSIHDIFVSSLLCVHCCECCVHAVEKCVHFATAHSHARRRETPLLPPQIQHVMGCSLRRRHN